jgi:quinol monooxygenase YgiN
LDTEPGTLAFEIMVPHDDADSILLYELYESPEAFDLHWNGPSIQQVRKEAEGLSLSLTGTRCALIE